MDNREFTEHLERVYAARTEPFKHISHDTACLHGTTIGAMKIGDGSEALAFSDGRVVADNIEASDYQKMGQLDSQTLVLFSGSLSVSVEAIHFLRTQLENYEKLNGPMSYRGRVRKVSAVVAQNLARLALPVKLIFVPILVGYDSNKKEVRISRFGPDGGEVSVKQYTIQGSGSGQKGHMKDLWKPDMTREQGIEVARDYLEYAAENDPATGGEYFFRIVGPGGVQEVK